MVGLNVVFKTKLIQYKDYTEIFLGIQQLLTYRTTHIVPFTSIFKAALHLKTFRKKLLESFFPKMFRCKTAFIVDRYFKPNFQLEESSLRQKVNNVDVPN